MKHVQNPSLMTVKQGYKGNRVVRGQFKNEYEAAPHLSFLQFFKWALFDKPKIKVNRELQVKTQTMHQLPAREKDSVVWLGHAGFLITINKKRILIDPVLKDIFPMKRYAKAPIMPNQLREIEYICFSHAHMDHCQKRTIKDIPGNPELLVPLGAKNMVQRWKPRSEVQAAGWWQRFETEGVEIYYLPAYHWHTRGFDKNRMLWGSLLIKTKKKLIYHSGDTAYANHFKDIRKEFGKIDICLMPATFYEPEDAMAGDHMSISDSVKAFRELDGTRFIPMHYGTINLSNHDVGPTLDTLKKAFEKHKGKGTLEVLPIGKTYYF